MSTRSLPGKGSTRPPGQHDRVHLEGTLRVRRQAWEGQLATLSRVSLLACLVRENFVMKASLQVTFNALLVN